MPEKFNFFTFLKKKEEKQVIEVSKSSIWKLTKWCLDPAVDSAEGFVICLNVYLSGWNYFTVSMQSKNTSTNLIFSLWSCVTMESKHNCSVYVKINSEWTELTKRTFGWMHLCLDYDFTQMNLSVSCDQTTPHTAQLTSRIYLNSLEVSWVGWNAHIFPEMFTMLNIFTR